jgi:Mce-associated membrane protein
MVAGAAFIFVSLPRLLDDRHEASGWTASVAAARKAARDALSYDYRHVDASLQRMRADADPHYAGQLEQTAAALRAAVHDNHVVASARVVASGLEELSGDTAVVLVFVDQTTRSQVHPTPATQHHRVRLTMTHSAGRWLLTALKPL